MTILYKVKYKLKQWYQAYILKDPDALLALEWIRNDRKFDYRHRYPLSKGAIIFDCGGYKGEWTEKMLKMYPESIIYVFEVIPEYIEILNKKFGGDSRVKVYGFGLGKENKTLTFSIENIASSAFLVKKIPNERVIEAPIHDVIEFMDSTKIDHVDLVKMNIEGGEYDLLDKLISEGYITRFKDLQIQFHNYGSWSVEHRNKLRALLAKTHELTYDYAWTFENWRLKDQNS